MATVAVVRKTLCCLGLVVGLVLAGCAPADEPVPAASDTTCTPDYIQSLKTEKAQKQLGTACFLRVKPTSTHKPQAW
jgi:entry exclusion lipoprotein TrbK